MAARKKVFSWLNIYRKTNSEAARVEYMKVGQEYKVLCKQKNSNFFNNVINSFKGVRDSKNFWECAKLIKNKKYQINPVIASHVWVEYFKKLLNSGIQGVRISYAPPDFRVEVLDGQILTSELKEILNKSKRNKAPGFDRISYEFYKEAP